MRIINAFYGHESYVNKYSVTWIKKIWKSKKGTTFILITKYMSKKYYCTLKKFFLFFELFFILFIPSSMQLYSFPNFSYLCIAKKMAVFYHAIVSFKRLDSKQLIRTIKQENIKGTWTRFDLKSYFFIFNVYTDKYRSL